MFKHRYPYWETTAIDSSQLLRIVLSLPQIDKHVFESLVLLTSCCKQHAIRQYTQFCRTFQFITTRH